MHVSANAPNIFDLRLTSPLGYQQLTFGLIQRSEAFTRMYQVKAADRVWALIFSQPDRLHQHRKLPATAGSPDASLTHISEERQDLCALERVVMNALYNVISSLTYYGFILAKNS